jgi:hypothetical protein
MGTGAAFAVAGASAVTGNSRAANEGAASIQRYVRLGRTELQVSDISFGSSSNSDPDVVARAFDRGVNYFDSAESYRWGGAEEAIGKALKGRRDKVILTSKTKAGASESRSEIMKSLEDSLRRLQTDYVDIYFNHSVNDVDRLRNQEWLEFAELAKRQGKIRFRGPAMAAGSPSASITPSTMTSRTSFWWRTTLRRIPIFMTNCAMFSIGLRFSRSYRACWRKRSRKTSVSWR